MAYEIEGRLLEVCTCNVLCPCWVGEDPDYKTCDTAIAWGIEKGTIDGVDVDGLTLAVSAHIPKNILIPKSWKAVVFVDERATRRAGGRPAPPVHRPARWRGRRPGRPHRRGRRRRAVADHLHRRGRQGQARRSARSSTPRWRRSSGATGNPTTLAETVFSTIPGSPGLRGQGEPATRATAARHGIPSVDLRGPQRPAGPLPLRRLTRRAIGPMFAPAHLREPAARPGDPGRVARRARRARPGSRSGCWEGRRTAATSTTPAAAGPAAARGARSSPRLGPDDRRDDAAVEHPAGHDLRGARRSPPPAAAGSSRCCSPAISSCGAPSGSAAWVARSRHPRRGRGPPVAGRAPPAHHRRRPCSSPGCGSSARSAIAASTSAAARSASS